MPKVNTYFYTAQGEYSDYGVNSHYKVLKDFNFIEQVKTWLLLEGTPSEDILESTTDNLGNVIAFRFKYGYETKEETYEYKYFKFLEESGYIEELLFEEYHTGYYGHFEIS